jgi:hypothetical protein
MSRAYRITWVSAARTVTAKDTLSVELSLLGILPEGEMQELLQQELLRDGWSKTKGALEKKLGEVTARLSPDGKSVDATVEARREIEARGTSKGEAEKNLDAAEGRAKSALGAEAVAKLSQVEPELRQKLGEAVQRVYLEALKRKAASLGQIESIQQQSRPDDEYEVTIKIKA